MDKCFVYVLYDSSGIRYIGVSKNPEKRFKAHIHESKNKSGKSYNIRKSKWIRNIDFKFGKKIIFSGTEDECYKKEQYLISLARSKNINLVNTTSGGDRPPKINELPNKSDIIDKIRKKAIGRKISEETKKKMSEAHSKPHWIGDSSGYKNPRAKAVAQLDDSGNIIFIWSCAVEAVNALGLGRTSVTSVCLGNQKTAGGHKFIYF